jgi:aspartyl-tRNA(Asn)/glutamyl-tRNA(Gln) amidotransferase subunit C
MSLTLKEVEKIANLARLELTMAEKALYQEQLSAILDYAERLNQLALEGVPPTASAVALRNVMREDIVEPWLTIEDALFNASQTAEDQFKIQAVIDDD